MERLWTVSAGGNAPSIASIGVVPGVPRDLLVDKSNLDMLSDRWFMTDSDICDSHDSPDHLLLPRWPRARQAGVPWPENVPSVSHITRSHSLLSTRVPDLTSYLFPSSTLATFQSYFQPLTNVLRNPAYIKNLSVPSPQGFLNRVRNANAKEIALFGVTAAEVIGFFTVGEIIGRMNIVGYRGETAHH